MLQDHVAQVYLHLRLFELIIEPLVLRLDHLCSQLIRKPAFSALLKDLLIKLLMLLKLWGAFNHEDLSGMAACEGLGPAEYILLHHHEEAFSVY